MLERGFVHRSGSTALLPAERRNPCYHAAFAAPHPAGCRFRGVEMKDRIRLIGVDDGTTTAEYALVTMAAVTFAGILIKIVGGDEVAKILTDLVREALNA